jgi:DNA transformation protein
MRGRKRCRRLVCRVELSQITVVNNDSFKDFVLDQLQELSDLECRRMFGGYGLYRDEVFFGIIFKGRLYFKTDAKSAEPYLELGMKPFRPNRKQTLKNYYEVPVDIIEDRDRLAVWAKKAVRLNSSKAG